LGFADEAKGISNVFIFPVADNDGSWKGSEYFNLYQKIELGHLPYSSILESVVRQAEEAFLAKSLKTVLAQSNDAQYYIR
jgi:hypothetical protein